ncbi:MAG TPA: MarR family transcriptional regulator [Chthoniobacter sp.]|nr:MarR family transcriptional regulator [Chthoniobacter sp.]
MNLPPRDCAAELLEVVPMMMRVIRAKVRANSSPELSVPQFRALAFLGRNEGAMLGDVASFLVLTLSAASKLVDGLVTTGLVARESDPLDRRKIVLKLTPAGERKFAAVREATADFLTERVAEVSVEDRACIAEAMRTLRGIFSDVPPEIGGRVTKPEPSGVDN